MRVAVGREHLKHSLLDAKNGDVEGTAPKVVHRDKAGVTLVEAIGERRRRRFVDDPDHVEPGDTAGVTRRGALCIVEVRGHGDDGPVDLRIDIALLGKERLGAVLQFAEDERRDFRRGEFPLAEPDADDAPRFAGDAEWEEARFVTNVVEPFAHEPLDGVHGTVRVGEQPALRFAPDIDRFVVRRHDRRHQRAAVGIANDDGHAVLHEGDEAVGGAQINSDDFAHVSADSPQRIQRTRRPKTLR